jgi:diadenosine tetraphosphate (Ap4A) HIT family hydrolase
MIGNIDKNFLLKFRVEELLVRDFEHWIVSLRPQQITIGSLVLTLKRPCYSFANLTETEASELAAVYRFIESKLQLLFLPDKINYLTLMMMDSQVHTHVLPRYQSERVFSGLILKDNDWPKPANILSGIDLPEEKLLELYHHFTRD